MARISLDHGRWFDPAVSQHWDEGTEWDGRNHISLATGSQWSHERLYRTRTGRWVLNRWSQWQGTRESYEEIDTTDAAAWLVQNEHEPPAECAAECAALEI